MRIFQPQASVGGITKVMMQYSNNSREKLAYVHTTHHHQRKRNNRVYKQTTIASYDPESLYPCTISRLKLEYRVVFTGVCDVGNVQSPHSATFLRFLQSHCANEK